MGCDKARLPLRGLPLAAAVAEVFAEAGLSVTLIRRIDDRLPWVDRAGRSLRVILEPSWGSRHPLYGVAEAVRDAGGEGVCLAACDLVGLRVGHLRTLLAAGEGVALDEDGRRHPLLACWSGQRFRVDELVQAAEEGASVGRVFAQLPGVELPGDALVNVNRPEDRPPSPLAALAAGLPAGVDVARVVAGEVTRQGARGIVEGVSYRPEEG